jgi:hypothetical protein
MLWILLPTVCLKAAIMQEASRPFNSNYSWYGQFVALDEKTRVLTVGSRMLAGQNGSELSRFKPGERIVLAWSGFIRYDIIRATPYDAAKLKNERLAFPVEFVSFDAESRRLTFKVQIPATYIEMLKPVKPGDVIIATSPYRPASEAEAVVRIKPYRAISTRN